jgi:hypothetical protein
MESHEEKLANMIKASKMNEAKEEMKRKVSQIDKQKQDTRRAAGEGSSLMMEGFGKMLNESSASLSGSAASFGGAEVYRPPEEYAAKAAGGAPAKALKAGGGMQLGKKNPKVDLIAAMAEEGSLAPAPGAPRPAPGVSTSAIAAAAAAGSGALQLNVEEKVVATLGRDGGVHSLEVKGELQLLVSNPAAAKLSVAVVFGENANFQFKTHPNINKQLFAEQSVLGLKDAARSFPPGNALGVLKWRLLTTEPRLVPLTVNCWPSVAADGSLEVTLEYELARTAMELGRVSITIPFPPGCAPPNFSCEAGEAAYSPRTNSLSWSIALINSANPSGTLEFTVTGARQPLAQRAARGARGRRGRRAAAHSRPAPRARLRPTPSAARARRQASTRRRSSRSKSISARPRRFARWRSGRCSTSTRAKSCRLPRPPRAASSSTRSYESARDSGGRAGRCRCGQTATRPCPRPFARTVCAYVRPGGDARGGQQSSVRTMVDERRESASP